VRIPIISLWRPWANWVVLGWKEIETRLHKRFYSLEGKDIYIHASAKWDFTALDQARRYLSDWKIKQTYHFQKIDLKGAIIGKVSVTTARPLTAEDSSRALIDCESVQRHGLVLAYPRIIEAIPCRGRQGIWYQEENPNANT
jgi:hypothetical protein